MTAGTAVAANGVEVRVPVAAIAALATIPGDAGVATVTAVAAGCEVYSDVAAGYGVVAVPAVAAVAAYGAPAVAARAAVAAAGNAVAQRR